MRTRESGLTRELLSLYLKYGAEAFEATARELRSGEIAWLIADTLDNLQRAMPKARSKAVGARSTASKKTKKELVADRIWAIKKTGSAIAVEIAEFVEKVMNREILGTSISLRDYMAFIGVPLSGRHLERYDAVKIILEYLNNLPEGEARERIRAISQIQEPISSLQRWTDIIVKPERSR